MSVDQQHDTPAEQDDTSGPSLSTASLQAALDIERANVAQLRQLSDHQRRMLGRRMVRLALSLDRRVRRAQATGSAEVTRLRQRAAQARLAVSALPGRNEMAERRHHLETAAADLPEPPVDTRSVTMIVLTGSAGGRIPRHNPRDVEVIVVLTNDEAVAPVGDGITVVPAGHKTVAAAARDVVRMARNELLCITWASSEPLDDGWLDRLTATISDEVVAAVPMLVHPERSRHRATPHDLRIRSLGVDIESSSDASIEVRAHAAGQPVDVRARNVQVGAGTSGGLVLRRDTYREAGGLAQIDDLDAALVDLCARMRAGGGKVVAVPSAVLVDHREVSSIGALTQPISTRSEAWHTVLERQELSLSQMAANRPVTTNLLVRMTVPAPSSRVAHRWGDWHLADGLAKSLRRHGHSVHMQTLADLDSAGTAGRQGDVHLVLRGAARIPRRRGERRVLWVISHPETIEIEECDESDLVLVASEQFAAELRSRTDTPVEVLLQATDVRRFSPTAPDEHHAHAVAVVAMTRHVFRPSVRAALEVGLRPAIYGSDWTEFVDPRLIVADFVPNEKLPVIYSSAGVLLNDHWETMRAWGFVSNRIYDGLACGTPIVSDHIPEIAQMFGDAVGTFTTPEELRAAVDRALEDPLEARRRAEVGRQLVLAHHTFDHRAEELLGYLERYGLIGPGR